MMTTAVPPDVRLEAERTAADGHPCAFCGTQLRGGRRPEAKFCTDACRARSRRQAQRDRVARLLDTITQATIDLRREVRLPVSGDGGIR